MRSHQTVRSWSNVGGRGNRATTPVKRWRERKPGKCALETPQSHDKQGLLVAHYTSRAVCSHQWGIDQIQLMPFAGIIIWEVWFVCFERKEDGRGGSIGVWDGRRSDVASDHVRYGFSASHRIGKNGRRSECIGDENFVIFQWSGFGSANRVGTDGVLAMRGLLWIGALEGRASRGI